MGQKAQFPALLEKGAAQFAEQKSVSRSIHVRIAVVPEQTGGIDDDVAPPRRRSRLQRENDVGRQNIDRPAGPRCLFGALRVPGHGDPCGP